jgi:TetR/AcrR family transcriptional regulator, transcriptional repressor for nem operon
MIHNLAMTQLPAKMSRGRPREFIYDDVVDRAITLFRQRGYGATSISDLVDATALTRGSLYKAFKDKKSIYVAAFECYVASGHERIQAIVHGEGTGRERIARLLAHYLSQSTGDAGRLGCLVVATGLEASVLEKDIALLFQQALKRLESTLSELIIVGIEDKSIPDSLNATAAAKSLLCFLQGLRVVGKSDSHREHLNKNMLAMAMKMLA